MVMNIPVQEFWINSVWSKSFFLFIWFWIPGSELKCSRCLFWGSLPVDTAYCILLSNNLLGHWGAVVFARSICKNVLVCPLDDFLGEACMYFSVLLIEHNKWMLDYGCSRAQSNCVISSLCKCLHCSLTETDGNLFLLQ